MKWKLVACALVLACIILQAMPVMSTTGTTEVSGTVPLVTYDISVSDIGYHSATISWKTNGNATSQVFYDNVSHDSIADYGRYTDEDTSLVSEHSITLTGLTSSTTYHYRVKSVIPDTEFIATSDDYTFTTHTLPEPGPSPPPSYYEKIDFFGETSEWRISSSGRLLETVEITSKDDKINLYIPEGTFCLHKEGNRLRELVIKVEEEAPKPPKDCLILGKAYNFGPDGATFDPYLRLALAYEEEDIPEGVKEENLYIAYYDSAWVPLDSIVDAEANTISAKVSHFTVFAVFGYEVAVPPVIPPVPPVPPAAFTVSHLSISPSEVYIGERVSIRLIVANTGGESGSYEVTLKINGVVEATKEVTVYAGLSKEITFTLSKDIAGTYSVAVDGLTGSFIVKDELVPEAPEIPPAVPKPTNWPLIGGIIAGVIVVGSGILFLVRRRALRNRIRG